MEKICGRCGAAVGQDDNFCMTCGANLEKVGTQEAPKAQTGTSGTWQEQKPVKKDNQSKEPLTLGNYLLMFLVVAIPGVNLIFLFMWAFSEKENINRKNFSKAALLYILATTVIAILCVVWFIFMAVGIMSMEHQDIERHNTHNHVEKPIPNHGTEQFFPEPSNDRIVTFTSFEKKAGDVEISTNGARII